MNLPNSIKYGTVKWTALNAIADDAYDPDRDPNSEPIPNVTVTFTASIPRIVVQDPSPVTIFLQTVTARTNENGVLIGPDGLEGIRLVATDNAKTSPVNFTYRVNISGIGVPITFDVSIPSDATIDLSFLVPIVSSAGKVLVPERGEKGEPGGFNTGTNLGTSDLNMVITPGLYRQASTGATLERNYPIAGRAYSLVVYPSGSTLVQVAYPFSGVNNNETGRVQYERVGTGDSWSPWRAFASQRVDNSAGKAIYTWDDVAGKEQLIYGDTGSRSMLLPNTTDQYAYIRRVGSIVELHATALKPNVVGNANYANYIPVGFRPPALRNFQSDPYWSAEDSRKWRVSAAGYLDIVNMVADDIINLEATWTTHEAWPTTLPGSPWAAPI